MAITKCTAGGLQKRAPRHDGWTLARRTEFLDELATSCNVRRACRLVGIRVDNAYRLRKRDPQFAALWLKACDQGAQRLEEELLAYSLGQIESEENPTEERGGAAPVIFDAKQALDTLKWRATRARPAGAYKPLGVSPEHVDAVLMARLDALAKRLGKP